MIPGGIKVYEFALIRLIYEVKFRGNSYVNKTQVSKKLLAI